jgi:hypothetical protein
MERKYEELYSLSKKLETSGRWNRRLAPFLAVGVWFAGAVLLARFGVEDFGLPSLVIAIAFLIWRLETGMKIILEAQRTLILVDTEHNTAEIAELLRGNRDKAEAKAAGAEPAPTAKQQQGVQW